MILHIFNPENDLALADGSTNYFAPSAAMSIAHDLATLPLWFASPGDVVQLPGLLQAEFRNKVAEDFDVAAVYDEKLKPLITTVEPWGWSPQMHKRMQMQGFAEPLLPSMAVVNGIRELSNRCTSIKILKALEERGIEISFLPEYFTNPADVANFINSRERCVVKAPWSGSGKGIAWGIGRVEPPMEHFYTGVIKRQGGVVCEEFLDKEIEFAMEFHSGKEGITFAGYSLFTSFKGSYSGNILASNEDIEEFITSYIPKESIDKVRKELQNILNDILAPSGYTGYFGIDMMIYKTHGNYALHPCMELNLRMNMGMAARRIFDTHVHPASKGVYRVIYFKNDGEALEIHYENSLRYRQHVQNGRIKSGYINFNPVTSGTRYIACAIVDDVPQSVASLYTDNGK